MNTNYKLEDRHVWNERIHYTVSGLLVQSFSFIKINCNLKEFSFSQSNMCSLHMVFKNTFKFPKHSNKSNKDVEYTW